MIQSYLEFLERLEELYAFPFISKTGKGISQGPRRERKTLEANKNIQKIWEGSAQKPAVKQSQKHHWVSSGLANHCLVPSWAAWPLSGLLATHCQLPPHAVSVDSPQGILLLLLSFPIYYFHSPTPLESMCISAFMCTWVQRPMWALTGFCSHSWSNPTAFTLLTCAGPPNTVQTRSGVSAGPRLFLAADKGAQSCLSHPL